MLHAHDPNSPIKPKYLTSEAVAATPSVLVATEQPTQIPYVNSNNISFGHHVQQPQLHLLQNNNHHVALHDPTLVSSQPQHHDNQRYHLQQELQQHQQPLYQHQLSNHSTSAASNSTNGNSAQHQTPCNAQALMPHLQPKYKTRNQQPRRHNQQFHQPAGSVPLSGSAGITENGHGNVSASSNTVQVESKVDISTQQQNPVKEHSLYHQQREQSHVQVEMLNHPPSPPENNNEHSERISPQQSASFMSHHDAVCGHLYQTGFLGGLFSDVTVNVPNLLGGGKAYNLHSLVLARSPLLFRLLAESSTRGEVTLFFDDENINEDGLAIAIGHLYAGYSQHLVHPLNATAVLAAAHLLELDDLASIAAERIKADINRGTILWYVRFVSEEPGQPVYGRYTTEIRDVCFHYITKVLPREMHDDDHNETRKSVQSSRHESVPSSPISKPRYTASAMPTNEDITSIFVALPFHWLKSAIESSQFCISSDMKRYQFAQNVISMREKIRSMRAAKGEIEGGGEESVVLSFGRSGSNGRTVTIVRKPIKGSRLTGRPERVLWKVPM